MHSLGASVASAGVATLPVDAGITAGVGGSLVAAGHSTEAAGKAAHARRVAAAAAADRSAFGKQPPPS